ncbi:uncharacterized protein LOC127852552 [Dreissena polymorpha]|uniref:uncharacterized protein LOC127852552 n=1 Tax=Dreissena polymorpha TaxID=45954 RepID=UPI002264B88C|nr:uncharacterized protein LOC127852552 [Dreissena polymorpha]
MLDFSKYRSAALTIYECQVIFLDSYADLHALVDRDQLTTDYGGTLQYNHRSWVDFHKAYYPIIDEASSTKNMLFDIARCVRHALGKRRDALDGTDALDTFATVRNKKAVFLDLELERVLEDGQESLEKLQHPEFDPILVKLPAGFLNNAVATLNDNLVKIKECSELVKTHFEEMEMEINMYHSLKECKYQVEEVVETICLMRQEAEDLPDIGSNSWEAFHNRQYFIKHILTPSKEIVDCADSVLADLHAVGMKTGSSSRTRTMEDQLKAELESFTLRINQLNETYVRLHLFYVIFDKAKRWLNSLVRHLEKHRNNTPTQRNDLHIKQDTDTLANNSGEKWQTPSTQNTCDARLTHFLQKHPAPKEQHLLLLSKYVPSSVQSHHIQQALELAKRLSSILIAIEQENVTNANLHSISWKTPSIDIDSCHEVTLV